MRLTGTWAKDRTGALVMTWTDDESPMPTPQPRRPAQEPCTRHHERRATGLALGAMLSASFIPEAPGQDLLTAEDPLPLDLRGALARIR